MRLDQSCIRRHFLTVGQYQDVTRHHLRRVDLLGCTCPQGGGFEHQQPVEGFQLFLGAEFFEEIESNAQNNDTKDEIGGQPASTFPRQVANRKSQDGGKQ